MKHLLWLLVLLPLSAQPPGINIQRVTADPTGQNCNDTRIALLTPQGNLYTCQSGHMAILTGTGSGTVTTFSAGNLSPLFNSSVANATTTPALTFTALNFTADSIFGNFTAGSAAPSTQAIPACANDGSHALVYPAHTLTCETITASGAPAFSAITSATNTSAAMVVGTGASLATSGSGSIAATAVPVGGVTGLGTGVGTALGLPVSGTGNICLTSGSACGGVGSVTWQAAGSTVVTGSTLNFATGSLVTNVGGVATVNPDPTLLLTNGNDQANHCKFVNSTNGTTSYTGSLASGCTALLTGNLVAGSAFLLRANATCTTSCTLQIDGVPAVAASIKQADGTTDPNGAIIAGEYNWVMYDGPGGVFRLLPGGTGGSGPTLQTNGVNNTTQTALNFITSTTNSVGLTVTPSNPATSQEKMEITGNYSGVLANGVTATTQTAHDNSTKVATTAYADQVCDPTVSYCQKDDWDAIFINAQAGLAFNTNFTYYPQNSGAGSVSCNTAALPAGMFAGYCELDTGGTALNAITLRAASGQGQFALNATTFDYKIRAKLSTTATVRAYMGWIDPGQVFAWVAGNMIMIRYDTNLADTNFMCVAASGGTTTATSTGVAADTSVHTFRIRSTTPGTVLCSVDGGTEVSVSTNIPTIALEYDVALLTDANAVESLTLDYWKMYVALSR